MTELKRMNKMALRPLEASTPSRMALRPSQRHQRPPEGS